MSKRGSKKTTKPSPKSAGRTMVTLLTPDQVEQSILFLRGERVLLDEQLAVFYGVETKTLVRAVKRNIDRFPDDFMFQLTSEEWDLLRSQSVTSRGGMHAGYDLRCQVGTSSHRTHAVAGEVDASGETVLRCQNGTSKREAHGGRRYAPYAFTEQGVAMLSSVLRSKQAVAVNVEIMRAFVRLRQLLTTHKELADRIARLERAMTDRDAKVDSQIEEIVALLAQLFNPPDPPKNEIGFQVEKKERGTRKEDA